MNFYLVTYRPLIGKKAGRDAIKEYNLPPYIDGSCRREPDLQSAYPSISALCRGGNFAPRLCVGDMVIYITCLGSYPGFQEPHWRLTAILEVCERFASHQKAADWYRSHHLPLPSNCIVANNPPIPLEKTIRRLPHTSVPRQIPAKYTRHQLPLLNSNPILSEWDQRYQERVKKWSVFLACKPVYPVRLYDPLVITRKIMLEIFNEIPPTLTPPPISMEKFIKLKSLFHP